MGAGVIVVAIVQLFCHYSVMVRNKAGMALCHFHHDIIHNETEIYIHILPSTTPPPSPSSHSQLNCVGTFACLAYGLDWSMWPSTLSLTLHLFVGIYNTHIYSNIGHTGT